MPRSLSSRVLLNQYRVDEYIGQTPQGECYRATDLYRDRPLSLTLLARSSANDPDLMRALTAAAPKIQSIKHPNLGTFLGLYRTPTLAFLLEAWVDGPSMKEVLQKAPASVGEALTYAMALGSALEALHTRGLLHTNLSAELIRISRMGDIILGGSAFVQAAGERWIDPGGKYPPLYHSPEQIRSDTLSVSSDIYSLAVLLYQLTTGAWINGKSPPKTADAIRRVHLDLSPPAPASIQGSIPDHFSRMLLWALRKDPQGRLKTTTELLSALALAAKIPMDQIPRRAERASAPITASVAAGWKYLPPPNIHLVTADAVPLEERLITVSQHSSPHPKPNRRSRLLPIIGLLLIAGAIPLIWFVRPVNVVAPTPGRATPTSAETPPPPTSLQSPKPTVEHGGRIAFTCTRGEYNQLCMVNRDGTGFAQLTDMEASNYYPTFSPDGGALLFASNRNGAFDIYRLVFAEKDLIQLTDRVGNAISPDHSPDGRSIVFGNRSGGAPTAIWIMNSDGSDPRMVYQGAGPVVAVKWSPDGDSIAYAMSAGVPQEYEIFTMDAGGGNHRRLTQGIEGIGGSLDWSPDGRYLLIYAGPYADKDIFRLEVETGRVAQLTNGGNNAGGSYSPDGKYIVFNSMRNDDQADLYLMRADGTNQQQLTNHPEPDWAPQWAP
jgi:TolB protein